jgi:hypothetical protein
MLQPFQQFIAGSLFGWYTKNGHRRFRDGLHRDGEGIGKTPFGAGLMLYMLVADGERGAQVYAAATSRDQAKLAFTDAERMVEASPPLRRAARPEGQQPRGARHGSFFRPISSEKRGLDGKRVHGASSTSSTSIRRRSSSTRCGRAQGPPQRADREDHEQRLRPGCPSAGTITSTRGRCSPARSSQRRLVRVRLRAGPVRGVAAGPVVPADDCPNCDDWKTEGPHWLKANPNLGVSLPWQYLRDLVNQAKGMPSEVSDLLRFNFCVWTNAQSRAIDLGKWQGCQAVVSTERIWTMPPVRRTRPRSEATT